MNSSRSRSYRPIKFHQNPSITSSDTSITFSDNPVKYKNMVQILSLYLYYDPDRAQKLISLSMSQHLLTRNISSKSMHAFFSNLANRQTDRQTDKCGRTHLPPPLSEVKKQLKTGMGAVNQLVNQQTETANDGMT